MICNHCGKEIPDSAGFCSYCGNKIERLKEKVPEGGIPVVNPPHRDGISNSKTCINDKRPEINKAAIKDENNIDIIRGSTIIELKRVS